MKTKIKTSVSLSPEVRGKLKKLADAEDRSVSYVLELVAEAFARVAEDSAEYGMSLKELGKQVEKIGDGIAQKGGKSIHTAKK